MSLVLFNRHLTLRLSLRRPPNASLYCSRIPPSVALRSSSSTTLYPLAHRSPSDRYARFDKMKSAHVFKKSDTELEVQLKDLPIPKPEPGQILIQVVVSGTNPKDWKYPLFGRGVDGLNSKSRRESGTVLQAQFPRVSVHPGAGFRG